MTREELAELEMHLAAGTDLPTALAAMEDGDEGEPAKASPLWTVATIAGIIAFTVWLLWK
jgi:hypothetical protein